MLLLACPSDSLEDAGLGNGLRSCSNSGIKPLMESVPAPKNQSDLLKREGR